MKLYPKNDLPFSEELFKNPTCEYRATPFWSWNGKLEKNELLTQIDEFKKMGYGGFHMHVRTGLETQYMSDEFMSRVRDCVEKAKQNDMLAWLYDEDRYPSGSAGGLVTRDRKFRQRYLEVRNSMLTDDELAAIAQNGGEAKFIGCFALDFNKHGLMTGYTFFDKPYPYIPNIFFYECVRGNETWYNNKTYVDTLDKEAMLEFIRITHEKYKKWVGDEFGKRIPSIFTDEPEYMLSHRVQKKGEDGARFPWSRLFDDKYKEKYGESIIPKLPELVYDMANCKSLTRYRFFDLAAELLSSSFADTCGKWCDENGIYFTGHVMEEVSLESQTAAVGEAMRFYRSLTLPGVDTLIDNREYTTLKQTQSAAHQYGREAMLSECDGVTNWHFDFRGHKLHGDFQAALGVNVRVPHLAMYTMSGEGKRDFPASIHYQQAWWEKYPVIENHFARVASAMTRGTPVCDVAVIHPIESAWLCYGAVRENDELRAMDAKFRELADVLLTNTADFDYVCESTLPALCPKYDTAVLNVGKMSYGTVVVPGMLEIRSTTLERLAGFKNAGGRLIFMGDCPSYVDGVPSDAAAELYAASEVIENDAHVLLGALENVRALDILDENGAHTGDFLYQMRREGNLRRLFIAKARAQDDCDDASERKLTLKLRGAFTARLLDTLTGEIKPLRFSQSGGFTLIYVSVFAHDSLLIELCEGDGCSADLLSSAVHASSLTELTEVVPVTLSEPNVLVLDMAEYAFDCEKFLPKKEILSLDNEIRRRLGLYMRDGVIPQPWSIQDYYTGHVITLRYVFYSDSDTDGAEIALEEAGITYMSLNGTEVPKHVDGYFADRCIGKRKMPRIYKGENVLIVKKPYFVKTNLESMYILGDFSVRTDGNVSTIGEPVRKLRSGDICTQGLPFYGANITYHLTVKPQNGVIGISVPQYRGGLICARLDGKEYNLTFAPFTLTVNVGDNAERRIDIEFYGTRVNTFGQIHNRTKGRDYLWWGPSSWRDPSQFDENYRFWEQGVVKLLTT